MSRSTYSSLNSKVKSSTVTVTKIIKETNLSEETKTTIIIKARSEVNPIILVNAKRAIIVKVEERIRSKVY